jgi:hypothetical protein
MAKTDDVVTSDVSEVQSGYVQLIYGLFINAFLLKQQCDVWANQALAEAGVSMYHVFGKSKREDQIKILEDIYLYSFAKAYLSGTIENYRGSLSSNSGMLSGHALLHKMLRDGSTVDDTSSGYQVYRRLVPDDNDRTHNLKVLRSFTVLGIPNDDGLAFQYSNPVLDMQLSKYEDSVQKTSCILSPADIESGCVNNFNTSRSNPLGNSCFSEDFKTVRFAYSPSTEINSIDYSFCLSCFIYSKDIQKEKGLNPYYHSFSTEHLWHFIKYHVQAVSTQRPVYNPGTQFDHSLVINNQVEPDDPIGPDSKDDE